MQTPFDSSCALRHRVVGNKYVRTQRQLGESRTVAIGVATKDNALAANLDSPSESGHSAVNDLHRIQHHGAGAKNEGRCRSGHNIVRLQLVSSPGARFYQFAKLAKGTVRITEHIVNKLRCGRHEVVSSRAINRQGTGPVFKPGGKNQCRKVTAMVDMEMTEEKDVRLRHLSPALPKSESAAAARIQDDPRRAVLGESRLVDQRSFARSPEGRIACTEL